MSKGRKEAVEILHRHGELNAADYEFWCEYTRLADLTSVMRERARLAASGSNTGAAIRFAFMAGACFAEWMGYINELEHSKDKLRKTQLIRIGEIAHKNLSDGNDARKQESIESARLVSAELLKRHKETGAKKKRIMQAMANDPTGQWGGLTTIKKHCQGVVLR